MRVRGQKKVKEASELEVCTFRPYLQQKDSSENISRNKGKVAASLSQFQKKIVNFVYGFSWYY